MHVGSSQRGGSHALTPKSTLHVTIIEAGQVGRQVEMANSERVIPVQTLGYSLGSGSSPSLPEGTLQKLIPRQSLVKARAASLPGPLITIRHNLR